MSSMNNLSIGTRSKLPLKGLRAFEAASRHLNFKLAAEELGLTPSAISHQIRALEQHLECKLFIRRAQGVALTDAGIAIAPDIIQAFNLLQTVMDKMRSDASVVRLSAAPVFAQTFLISRLNAFEHAHKGIELQLQITLGLVDISNNQGDVGIRYGAGHYPGLYSERLGENAIGIVCSPDLLDEPADLETIRQQILISNTFFKDAWSRWFAEAGSTLVPAPRQVWYESLMATLEAARNGVGVTLTPLSAVQEDLRYRRLVQPHATILPSANGYYLVCRKGEETLSKIQKVRNWVRLPFEEMN